MTTYANDIVRGLPVGTSEGDRPLAGLVSEQAEHLYARLAKAGWLETGPGPDQVDIGSPAARELLEVRIAYSPPASPERLQAVERVTALQLLLAQRHSSIASQHEDLIRAWKLVDGLLSSHAGSIHSGAEHAALVEVIAGREQVNRIAYELQHSVQKELLGLVTHRYTIPLDGKMAITPPATTQRKGIPYRYIYTSEFSSTPAGTQMIEQSVADGEIARIRNDLPMKMLYVDDRIALLGLTPTGTDGSLLVRSTPLLAALRDWFELLWNDDGTTVMNQIASESLSPAQQKIVRLLASGMSDDAIARTSGMSVRTVRRHISAVMETLGVNSRFAAGAMAAKRGWI